MAELKNVPGLSRVSVAFIGETIKPDEQKTFVKREIAFTVSESINGNEYERLYCMQAVGSTDKTQFDKTKLLDNFKIGDIVDVAYSISGSTKKNDKLSPTENNPLCLTGFNNLSISRIEKVASTQPQPAYQHQPNYQPQHQPAQTATPIFYQQPAGDIPNDNQGQPMVWNSKTGNWEKLPF